MLAAGLSTRYGGSKLVEQFSDCPLIQHPLKAAQSVCPGRVIMVTGNDSKQVQACSADLADATVVNANFRSGIGSSIATGIRAVSAKADAVIVLLGDQPLITTEHLATLAEQWSGNNNAIVATSFDDVQGPPVLFGSATFDALAEMSGDEGARHLFGDDRFAVSSVPFADAAVDIDTPDDLLAATR
ncbi:MAG: nucleotidyltransferase family protein [Pseudomonadota bacterium]